MFVIHNNLLYYKRANADCLTISAIIRDEIFKLIHNKNSYIELHQCYQQIFKSLYVH